LITAFQMVSDFAVHLAVNRQILFPTAAVLETGLVC
jgi:hypothetical protein